MMNVLSGKIGYLGPEGTYSYLVARLRSSETAELIPHRFISDVIESVEKEKVEYGVIPVENSVEGRVEEALDELQIRNVFFYEDLKTLIHFCLIGCGSLPEIKQVQSKQEALSQCKDYLRVNLSHAEPIPVGSTAEAIKRIAEEKSKHIAAIGSEEAARKYGVPIIEKDITITETEFGIISKNDHPYNSDFQYKTWLIYGLEGSEDTPGIYCDSLMPFKINRVNSANIALRPLKIGDQNNRVKKLGKYAFYLAIQGYREEDRVSRAIKELEELASFLQVKGSARFVSF